MPVTEPAIRPPSEAFSFLLQVTEGCSANTCTFCGAYRNKPFRPKEPREVFTDIEEEGRLNPGTRRVFLMDGDALALNNARLVPVLKKLRAAFPSLSRVSSYANGYNITQRTDAELRELAGHKLTLIYMGLESGSQEILNLRRKRSGAEEMTEAVRKAGRNGIKSSIIVLLGLGGREFSEKHVQETALALNRMQPRYLSFLSLMLIPGTPLFAESEKGAFRELSPRELLREAREILERLDMTSTVFRCDHASNYLALEGRLPKDRARLVGTIDRALQGGVRLKPDFLRGL